MIGDFLMFKQAQTMVLLVTLLLLVWMVCLVNAADKPELYLESNVLAAGNYNEGTSSSDISLIIRIDAGDETIVDEGATVRYIVPQKNIEGWTEVDFDDTSWDVGVAGVGYGDSDDHTRIRDGAASVYTRYYFDASSAGKIDEISLLVDYDDAYVLWLNGVEIARTGNIAALSPEGEVPDWDVSAVRGAMGGHGASELPAGWPNEDRWKQGNLGMHFVKVGFGGQKPEGVPEKPEQQSAPPGAPIYLKDNILAGANFNDGPGSSDMTLIMRLMGDDEIYVDEGSEVKYIHSPDNADVEDSWIQVDYDDSDWADGISGVGFSDGDDNTVTRGGLISIWTRYHFDAPNADKIKELVLFADYDDGFIAWLNGVSIGFGGGAPAGDPPAWDATQGGTSNNGATELPAGEPNEARWKQVGKTVVKFRYGGSSALGVDARSKLSTTWGSLKNRS
jgi:hypothetical protein